MTSRRLQVQGLGARVRAGLPGLFLYSLWLKLQVRRSLSCSAVVEDIPNPIKANKMKLKNVRKRFAE